MLKHTWDQEKFILVAAICGSIYPDILPETQISANYRYIEINPNIAILQICQKTQISLDLKKHRYVGVIGNFHRLDLLQISTIFAIFHRLYLAGQTTKCCGRYNVSTSCAL
jgi:hypothetical protein